MVNIAFVVGVLSKIIAITYGDLDVSGISAGINSATGNLMPNVASLTYDLDFQSVAIPGVGNVGTIAIPVDTVCGKPGTDEYVFCYLCNQDCSYVHNEFGGTCIPHPDDPNKQTCLCAQSEAEAQSRNIDLSSKDTCERYLPSLPSGISLANDFAMRTVLLNRLYVLLCPKRKDGTYNGSGCSSDCAANHNYKGGFCAVTATRDSRLGTNKTLHCECY